MTRGTVRRRDAVSTTRASASVIVGRPAARVVDLVRSLPTWATILTIFVGSRVLSTFWLALAWPLIGRAQPANAIRGNDHGFLAFLTSWDGQYYQDISLHGYPSTLPMDAAGHVAQNNWAFLPAFPYAIRALTASTGITFEVGAPAIATLAGLIAASLLYLVIRERAGRNAALWGVLFFCIGPLSFLLEVGYAESMFLALTFGALLAIQRQKYVALTVLGVVAAFTRPGALAIPLTLAVVETVRYVRVRRAAGARNTAADDAGPGQGALAADRTTVGRIAWPRSRSIPDDTFSVRERIAVVISGAVMALAGFAWPLVAGHVTGDANAYLQTEMSWWVAFIGRVDFVPLTPWFLNAWTWLGVGGVVLVFVIVAGYVVWLSRRSTRKLGLVTVSFSAAYALYIFAVSIPMASTPRLLMPLAPLMGSPELVAKPWARWIMIGCALAGQPVLIAVLWLMGPP